MQGENKCVHTDLAALSAAGYIPSVKAAGMWIWILTSIQSQDQDCMEQYEKNRTRLQIVVVDKTQTDL